MGDHGETPAANSPANSKPRRQKASSRIPDGSQVYGRLLPALIIALGVLMVLLIVVAVGVLVGFVPFR